LVLLRFPPNWLRGLGIVDVVEEPVEDLDAAVDAGTPADAALELLEGAASAGADAEDAALELLEAAASARLFAALALLERVLRLVGVVDPDVLPRK